MTRAPARRRDALAAVSAGFAMHHPSIPHGGAADDISRFTATRPPPADIDEAGGTEARA